MTESEIWGRGKEEGVAVAAGVERDLDGGVSAEATPGDVVQRRQHLVVPWQDVGVVANGMTANDNFN